MHFARNNKTYSTDYHHVSNLVSASEYHFFFDYCSSVDSNRTKIAQNIFILMTNMLLDRPVAE